MKTGQARKEKLVSGTKSAGKPVNPIVKLMKDQERIAVAINTNQPLSSLKDIKFVFPPQYWNPGK